MEKRDIYLKYIPHGINEKTFFPIREGGELYSELDRFKKNIFKDKEYSFIVFWNSRNIRRKNPGDVILSYKMFCDYIGKDAAKDCALVMHTQPIDENGTDLVAVKDAITDPSYVNIFFSAERIMPEQMNLLYNIADVTMLISSNEGWGLSITESMMAGTMIIANVTGGMQDQLRFEKDGKWVDFDKKLPSNHRGSVKDCGEWGIPVFPSNLSLAGSVPTPYIFDERCRPEDVAAALKKVYDMPKQERVRRGDEARKWVTSDESMMSARKMCENFIDGADTVINSFVKRSSYDLIKIEDKEVNRVQHEIHNY